MIPFSHYYLKFPDGFEESALLDVLQVKLEDLSEAFLRFDTAYLDGGELRHYELPKSGSYMLLLLQAMHGEGSLWTTLRSQWGGGRNKLPYYQSIVGECVECRVIESVAVDQTKLVVA